MGWNERVQASRLGAWGVGCCRPSALTQDVTEAQVGYAGIPLGLPSLSGGMGGQLLGQAVGVAQEAAGLVWALVFGFDVGLPGP